MLKVFPDTAALAQAAARRILHVGKEAIRRRGRFTLLLSGGSTPGAVYPRLALPVEFARLDWRRVHLYWGDERCVAPDHPDSNYALVHQALLDHISLPEENIHRIQGELGAAAAATAYEADLRREFLDLQEGLPVFDLVMLGLGDDGHTASLFPGVNALDETERWAVAVDHSLPPPPLVPRVTVTLPVINAARRVLFLVAGGQKSEILYRVLMAAEMPRLPAQRVQPGSQQLEWLVDQPAASKLTS